MENKKIVVLINYLESIDALLLFDISITDYTIGKSIYAYTQEFKKLDENGDDNGLVDGLCLSEFITKNLIKDFGCKDMANLIHTFDY